MTLQTNFYFLSPVEVVRVTPKNLEEVAAWCGGKVAETESRRQEGRMDKYVWVPTPKGSAISWAFPGMFITKRVVITEHNELKITFSVFRKAYFKANYFQSPNIAVEETWERQQKEAGKKNHPFSRVSPKDLKNQIKGQIAEYSPDEDKVKVPETEVNGQGSMVEQREAIREAEVEMASVPKVIGDALSPFATGDPHRP